MKHFLAFVLSLFIVGAINAQGNYPPGTNVWYGGMAFPSIAPLAVECVVMSGNNTTTPGMLATQPCESNLYDLTAYGAKADERDLSDCTLTAGSATLTCPDGNFTTADNGRKFIVGMGTGGIAVAYYTSGVTATGSTGQYCTISGFDGGGSGASGMLVLSGTNTISSNSPILFRTSIADNFGTGYTSLPTTATASNGSATCSGTVIFSSPALTASPVTTTATYVNATTVTLATNSSITLSNHVLVSIGTDDSTAAQNWLNACQVTGGICYAAAGRYLITNALSVATPLTIQGAATGAVLGDSTSSGYNIASPQAYPYLTGTVFVQGGAGLDGIDFTNVGTGVNVDRIGIQFASPIAFWHTGYGFNATPTKADGTHLVTGLTNPTFTHDAVWGHDGNHYAFQLTNIIYGVLIGNQGYGGGFINLIANVATEVVGNDTIIGAASTLMTGGNTYNVYFHSVSGSKALNIISVIHCNCSNYAVNYANQNSYLVGWPIPGIYQYSGYNTYAFYADSTVAQITMLLPDFEGGAFFTPANQTFAVFGADQLPVAAWNGAIQQDSTGDFEVYAGRSGSGASSNMLKLGNTIESVYGANLSGCSYSAQKGGASAGEFTAGSATCSMTFTYDGTASNGGWCEARDVTNPADTFTPGTFGTTTCVVSGTPSIGDKIQYLVIAY